MPRLFQRSALSATTSNSGRAGAGPTRQVLEVARPRIRGAAEDEDALSSRSRNGSSGVAAEIRVDGDGVEAEVVEEGAGVGFRRVADVAALAVADDGDVARDGRERFAQDAVALLAQRLIEGEVRLVGADEVARRVDDGAIERRRRRRRA